MPARPPTQALRVTLATPPDGEVEGELLQTHFEAHRAALVAEFPLENTPDLAVGQMVRLRVSGVGLTRELHLPGRTSFQARGDTTIVHFQVGLEEGSVIDVAANRREEVRVRPGAADVRVVASDPESGLTCKPRLCDLSMTGLGLLLTLRDESAFANTWLLELELTLPGAERAITLQAEIRYRRLEGSSIRLGLEFCEGERGLSAEDAEIIEQFVIRRRAELLELVMERSEHADD